MLCENKDALVDEMIQQMFKHSKARDLHSQHQIIHIWVSVWFFSLSELLTDWFPPIWNFVLCHVVKE